MIFIYNTDVESLLKALNNFWKRLIK